MKLTKLLVLGALLLVGKNAWAGVDANVWQKPTFPVFPEVTEFATYKTTATLPSAVDGGELYLYNVGAHMFWTSGNNWATRASLTSADTQSNGTPSGEGVKGSAIYFVPTSAATALGDGVVEIKNFMHRDSKFLSAFGGNAFDDIWTDNDGRDDRFWKIVDQGNGTYRLQNVVKQKDLFVGWTADYADTRLYFLAADAEGAFIDWKLVSPTAYEAWYASLPENAFDQIDTWRTAAGIYKAAMDLKKALDEAEELGGVDAADQITVYNNTASTQAELTAATTAVTEKIAARKEAIEKEKQEGAYDQATGANPAVVTNIHINNPNFDNGSNANWEGSKPNMKGDNNHLAATVAEFYNATFDSYQDISSLREGVYSLSLQAGHRGSYEDFTKGTNANAVPYLYVVSGSDSVKADFNNLWSIMNTESYVKKVGSTTYFGTPNAEGETTVGSTKYFIPNNPSTFRLYAEDGYYLTSLFFETSGDKARVGVKKTYKATGTDWAMYDSFKLTYYGKGADAYQLWSDTELAKNAYTPAEGALYTESYQTALTAATTGKTATNKAEVLANVAAAEAARADLNKNIALWAEWKDLLKEAQEMIIADEYQEFEELDDLLFYADPEDAESESSAIEAAHSLDNAALAAEIEKVKGMMEDVRNAVKNAIKAGDNVTDKLLINPKFELKKEGWTSWENVKCADGRSMPVLGGTADNQTAEAWATTGGDFDLYQEVKNAPAGVYEIEVKGFYRYGRGDNAYNEYVAQEAEYVKPGGAPVFVYMNDVKTPFKNVYDEQGRPQEFYAEIADKDEEGNPKVNKETGAYTFGSNTTQLVNETNLHYPNGMTSAAIAFREENEMYSMTAKSLLAKKGDVLRIGVKGNTSQLNDSWAIWDNFKLTYLGFEVESVKPLLEEAIAAAQKNLEKGFGTDLRADLVEKLEAAQALLTSEDGKAMFDAAAALVAVDVDGSIALFAELAADINSLQVMAGNQMGITDEANVTEAYELAEEVSLKMEGNTLSDVEAKEYKDKIAEMMVKLKMPAGMENASDDNDVNVTAFITNPKYTDNKDDGWTGGAAVNYHEAEMFNKTFDYYQDLEDLLPGTYKVTVQGFYRAGGHGPANDYKTLQENPEENNNALLYVKAGDNTYQTPLMRLCKEMVQLAASEEIPGGWAAAKTDTLSWEPDTVVQHSVVPNDMEQAEVAFQKTDETINYSGNEVIFKVGDDGKARIGIKKGTTITNDWTIWTNWTLTYYGKNSALEPSAIGRIAGESRVVKTEYYSLSGSRLKSARGLVIVKQTMSDGRVRVIKKVK